LEVQEKLLNVAAVAEWLSVTQAVVYRMVANGELPAIRVGQERIRFRPKDINAYLDRHSVNPKAAA